MFGAAVYPGCDAAVYSDMEYETQSSNIPPAMAESTQDGLNDMTDLLITNWTNIEKHVMHSISSNK